MADEPLYDQPTGDEPDGQTVNEQYEETPANAAYDDGYDEPLKPICRHLRSKSMFVGGMQEPDAEMGLVGSGHCWCNYTQHVFGKDDQLVGRRECDDTRSCYERAM